MSEPKLTLSLPPALFDQLKRRAQQADRSVEDEVVSLLLAHIPIPDVLPAHCAEAISPLPHFNDEQLWNAARTRLPTEEADEMEELHYQRERGDLTEEGAQRLAELMRRYERTMLVRAEAAALLHRRGHDVSSLLKAS